MKTIKELEKEIKIYRKNEQITESNLAVFVNYNRLVEKIKTLKEVLEMIDERINLHEQHDDLDIIRIVLRELKELKSKIEGK